jgi:hypothetical protein
LATAWLGILLPGCALPRPRPLQGGSLRIVVHCSCSVLRHWGSVVPSPRASGSLAFSLRLLPATSVLGFGLARCLSPGCGSPAPSSLVGLVPSFVMLDSSSCSVLSAGGREFRPLTSRMCGVSWRVASCFLFSFSGAVFGLPLRQRRRLRVRRLRLQLLLQRRLQRGQLVPSR